MDFIWQNLLGKETRLKKWKRKSKSGVFVSMLLRLKTSCDGFKLFKWRKIMVWLLNNLIVLVFKWNVIIYRQIGFIGEEKIGGSEWKWRDIQRPNVWKIEWVDLDLNRLNVHLYFQPGYRLTRCRRSSKFQIWYESYIFTISWNWRYRLICYMCYT